MVLGPLAAGKDTGSRALVGLAASALRSGNLTQARQMLHERIALHPNDPDALEMLAQLAIGERSIEEATVLLQRAVGADPARRLVLVDHLRRYASPALALAELEQLPEAPRRDFEVMTMEAALCGALGLHERQVGLYRAMLKQRPASPGVWMSLGNAYNMIGRRAEAVKALQRAIRIEPTFGAAYWTLANFKSFRFSTRDFAQMRDALGRAMSAEDKLHIHFALGKALEDRGEYEQSFRHYSTANAIRAAGMDPQEVLVSQVVDESIATFDADFFAERSSAGCADPGPIFVVGLQRSGSTLIEQILASHPLVEGASELNVMKIIRDRLARSSGISAVAAIAALAPEDFRRIGEEYLERTRPFRQTDRPFFVDKLPGNWINLPLIRLALPNARIVDARRHPMACGFSNFKQNYASGVGFSYSLRTIGIFYRDYWRFMRHFDAVQPGAACRVVNEQLIDGPEVEVRRMLDAMGLPFDARCLDFHKNDRAVRTPSAEQVRRPINRDGVEQWRHYQPWLGELQEWLGPAFDQWAA